MHGGSGSELGRRFEGTVPAVGPGELGVHPVRRLVWKLSEEMGKLCFFFPIFFLWRRKEAILSVYRGRLFFVFCEKVHLAGDGKGKARVVSWGVIPIGRDFSCPLPGIFHGAVPQGGGHDPVQKGFSVGRKVGRQGRKGLTGSGRGKGRGPAVQVRGGVFHDRCNEELVPGPCHGHVEKAGFLGQVFPAGRFPEGIPVQAGPADPVLFVVVLDAKAQVFMTNRSLPGIPQVEFFPGICQEDHGKFKALALVDGHNVDRVGHGGNSQGFERFLFLFQLGQIVQEGVEPALRGAVPLQSQMIEGEDMPCPPGAAGKAGYIGEVVRISQYTAQQRRCAVLHAVFPPVTVMVEESVELLFLFFRKNR